MRDKTFLLLEESRTKLRSIVPKLLEWYNQNKRSMYWRDHPEPYYVWVSEIMLQQTRIEAVRQYFDRFINELPNISALAEVDEDKLMKLWEGLGYYNRVRNMQKAAKIMKDQYNCELPGEYEQLKKLPGIGSYTAGAVASIAFGVKAPAVDGNVLRVLMRLLGCYEDISKTSTKKTMEAMLMEIIPENHPGDFNQGIMELGETICIPNGRPLCEKCPVSECCKGYKEGRAEELPVKADKKARREEKKTVLLMEFQGRYAIKKRRNSGLLAGLWELPNLEGHFKENEIREKIMSEPYTDYAVISLGETRHIFSHVEWHMFGFLLQMKSIPETENLVWVKAEEIKEIYALPTAFRYFQKFIVQSVL